MTPPTKPIAVIKQKPRIAPPVSNVSSHPQRVGELTEFGDVFLKVCPVSTYGPDLRL